jgi:B12-binding domain/radical SAM domain protein
VSLVLHYRPYAIAALNVLLGSLEECADTPRLRLATGIAELIAVLREEAERGERSLVLWSFYSPDLEACARELSAVRAQTAGLDVIHVAGGPQASAQPWNTLESGFDYVAQGEGESLVRKLAQVHASGGELADCVGIASRTEHGQLRSTGMAERVELDAYPPIAYQHRRFNALEITRGCIYACGFCQTPFLFKARFRHRSVGEIRRAVSYMARHGCGYVRFLSPTSLSYGSQDESVQLDAVEELLRGVREELGAQGRIYFGTFPSELRPEHVTPQALAILKRYADNRQLVIGAQSGSERVLAAMHRGHGVEVVRAAVRNALEAGFMPNVDFLLGLPEETQEEVQLTLAFARELAELGARIHAHTFMPLPGTPWKAAEGTQLSASTVLELEQLASQGRAYGQWRAQERIRAALTRRKQR